MILCEEQFAKQIDKSIFPGIQGGTYARNRCKSCCIW